MCNRFGYLNPLSRLMDEFSALGAIRWTGEAPNAPMAEIRPTDLAPIIRAGSDGVLELVRLRWGLVPAFHRGAMKDFRGLNTNARCETVAALPSFREAYAARRALVPASCWYEWTGEKSPKTMWKFTVRAQPTFAFPGLWELARTADGPVESFTLLTSAPGPDQAPYHDRQPAVLEPAQWRAWLDPANDMAAQFARGSPAGAVKVEWFSGPKAPEPDRQGSLF